MSGLRGHAVPVGGVNDMEAVFEQPPAEALVVREPSSGEALGLKQVAYQRKGGAECSDYQGQQQLRSPPRYAEHTVDILCGELGMEEAEVAALLASGSVVQGEY
jgi:crotonobetainyl-CoA:carnitine CoA-transferase CaiB-like acyl-CoA transferase